MSPYSPRLPFGRILLTGGGGFVGRTLAPALARATPGAARLLLQRPEAVAARDGWDTVTAEITDREAVAAVVADFRPDLVLHLAAQSSVSSSLANAEETWAVNFGGSFALASACAHGAPEATVLFTSSSEIYGTSFGDGPVDESSPARPQNAYARSKLAAEHLLGDILPADARLIVARAFNHTGPGQDERFVLPSFAAQIARIEAGRQRPEIRVGNLEAARDFLDVQDVCDAYLRLLAATPTLPARSVFNVSSGSARPIRDFLGLLEGMSRVPFRVSVDPTRLRSSDLPVAVGRNDHLRRAVGWHPTRDIAHTLAAMLAENRSAENLPVEPLRV